MKKRHESELLNYYLFYHVEILFKDNKIKNGYLYKNNNGYFLRMRGGDYYFYKSHVKYIVRFYEKSAGKG